MMSVKSGEGYYHLANNLVYVEKRRALVAKFIAQGMSIKEVTDTLGAQTIKRDGQYVPNPVYVYNPHTGEPFTYSTIWDDVQALKQHWRERQEEATDVHRGQHLMMLQEIFRKAMAQNDLSNANTAVKNMMKLLGTDALQEKQISLADQQLKEITERRGSLQEQIDSLIYDITEVEIEDAEYIPIPSDDIPQLEEVVPEDDSSA